jgi:hypothetical protein
MSGSWMAWEFGGGVEAVSKAGTADLVDGAQRGVAAQRPDARGVLRGTRAQTGCLRRLAAEALQHKPSRKAKPPPRRAYSAVHGRAVQAFWAMHVEAQLWSGLSAAEYASALDRSTHTLRAWRRRLDETPLRIDWRALVHPSARPYVGSERSTRVQT